MGRNWDWAFQQGKEKRLELELLAYRHHSAKPRRPPLYSHDATMPPCKVISTKVGKA
ncbi:hypothetical protein [Vibrio splendidus]|jgi:hypothetical protein|uniref:hypothetical protein n=1 Tax=Vibrio splendidus TaxID=29497 RepID=UPI0021594A80|nr:hypothetical protein [Vibrio splendidus]